MCRPAGGPEPPALNFAPDTSVAQDNYSFKLQSSGVGGNSIALPDMQKGASLGQQGTLEALFDMVFQVPEKGGSGDHLVAALQIKALIPHIRRFE